MVTAPRFGLVITSPKYGDGTTAMLISRNDTYSAFTAEDGYAVEPGDWCAYVLAARSGYALAYPLGKTAWIALDQWDELE